MKKQSMINALWAFIAQRSGIDFRNYQNGDWKQSRESFMRDYRPILRHGKHARTMLHYVSWSGITAEQIKEASRAYSGRLQFVERDGMVACDYTTGQYFPTEYRNAACAVLAQAIWDYWSSDFKDSVSPGTEVRKRARREFGRAIASTWFN